MNQIPVLDQIISMLNPERQDHVGKHEKPHQVRES